MSINLGGIHVIVREGVTQAAVVRVIDGYFRKAGAKRSDRGARSLPELEVEDTGKLGVAVLPVEGSMIAVVDSERYTASEGLACHLAAKFETEVLHWTVSGVTDSGNITRYGPKGKMELEGAQPDQMTTNDAVIEYLGALNLPFLFTSYDDLGELPAPTRRATVVMGFRDVPFAAYDGGDHDDGEDEGRASPSQIAAYRDQGIAEGMVLWEPIEATPELRGLICEELFSHNAPYGYSAGGQNYGLLGLVTSLARSRSSTSPKVFFVDFSIGKKVHHPSGVRALLRRGCALRSSSSDATILLPRKSP